MFEILGRAINKLFIHSSKSSWATLCHFKKSKFSFTKTSHWKFLDRNPTHFAVRIAAPLGNNRSAAEELGDRVLYFVNTSTQICRYIPEVESRTRGSKPRPRTQQKSEAKAMDSLSEDRPSRGQGQDSSKPRPRTQAQAFS